MAIRKFRVKAVRTDEYVIEIDDEIYTEEWIKEFESYMFPLENGLTDIAEHLASHQIRNGSDWRFIEGFGNVLRDGKMPFNLADFDAKCNDLPEDQKEQPALGLNIDIDTEDEDYEFEIEEETV